MQTLEHLFTFLFHRRALAGNPGRRAAAVALLAGTLVPSPAQATTELPLRYNARSLGMGGTGVAFTSDPSAIAINPAGLDGMERWGLTFAVSPFFPRTTAPFLSDDDPSSPTIEKKTRTVVVPLFFAGAGLRVLERLSTGLAIYGASGFGGRYENLPEFAGLDMELNVAVFEVALPLSFRVTDELAIGASLRFSQAFMSGDMPIDIGGAGGPLRLEMNLSGHAFPGVLAGVWYHPSQTLAFGATYRSKTTIELEGDGTATHSLLGEEPLDVHSELSLLAHSFRAGAAWSIIPDRLLVALDVSYTLYDDAIDSLPVTIDFRELADTRIEQAIPFEWQNSLAVLVGAEYMLTSEWAARAGYHVAQSATPEDHAGPLFPPPILIHTLHLGGGLRLPTMSADVGGAYAIQNHADVSSTANGPPGAYGGHYWLLGASFTYRK